MQPFRLDTGGVLIDRDRPLDFRFNHRNYRGFQGDTLASALLANGVHLVGRGLKYHRPRGVLSAGVEEPNALVQLRGDGGDRPNIRATEIPLFEGLEAHSQNCRPSVKWDIGALNRLAAPLMPAGFYYKTFMGPGNAWPHYEPFIRGAAGLGHAPEWPPPMHGIKRHDFCDVLVAGAGPAGLMAALAAARAGARVVLADERPAAGGGLLASPVRVDGSAPNQWVQRVIGELQTAGNATVLRRANVFGRYRRGLFAVAEHGADGRLNQRILHHIQAGQAVMATGAIERTLVFANNDRPGIMLAGAVRQYIECFGVAPGRRAVILTNNDSAYETVYSLSRAGVTVAAVLDIRETHPEWDGATVIAAAHTVRVHGARHINAVTVKTGEGVTQRIRCDLLCVSGGWTPTLHLYAQGETTLAFDRHWGAFVPGEKVSNLHCAGTCNGTQGLDQILTEGWAAGCRAAANAGSGVPDDRGVPPVEHDTSELALHAAPVFEIEHGRGKRFVDFQNDVTTADLELALREGYRSIEHVKRYTTLGMGTDQGRTSNINGLRIVAGRLDQAPAEVGVTTFRPPYAPVPLDMVTGRESGPRIAPLRRSPMQAWHEQAGAVFMPSALWLRPQYYPRHGDDLAQAARAEAANVRRKVGMADVSTLGKIDIQGTDAAEFLSRIYINGWRKLKVGKARYGMMLREDGYVLDDGTTSRLGENHFFMTTTTANAEAVLAHMEFYHQMIWPELDVHMIPVTDQWATVALAGPLSREVLARLLNPIDTSNDALPPMGVLDTEVESVPVRVSRLSFSGERAYEVAVPAGHGLALWEAMMAAGKPNDIMPYGLEAMDYLRVEKGHVTGAEMDGRVSPLDLGMGGMLKRKTGYVGARSLALPVFHDAGRPALAGFVSSDRQTPVAASAQLVAEPHQGTPQQSLGHITSAAFSTALDCPIALGLISGGKEAYTNVYAVSPLTGEQTRVEVTAPVFYDPKGEKQRG